MPVNTNENIDSFLIKIKPYIFDLMLEPKLVNQDADIDNIVNSSNTFYKNISQKDVEAYYDKFNNSGNVPSWGLNSTLSKDATNKIVETV